MENLKKEISVLSLGDLEQLEDLIFERKMEIRTTTMNRSLPKSRDLAVLKKELIILQEEERIFGKGKLSRQKIRELFDKSLEDVEWKGDRTLRTRAKNILRNMDLVTVKDLMYEVGNNRELKNNWHWLLLYRNSGKGVLGCVKTTLTELGLI